MVRPVIVGCRTSNFLPEQLEAFRYYQPFGLTIFSEPAKDGKKAIRHVIHQFREAVGRPDAPAFIDQEGGSVNRLKPSFGQGWRAIPAAETFAGLALRDPEAAATAIYLNAQLIAADMREVDIHVDYAPVLDIFTETTFRGGADTGLHAASSDMRARMLGSDPAIVTALGRAFCRGLMHQGVVPVLKHVPGYGRVVADPHYSQTRVDTPLGELETSDFVPFRALAGLPAAMVAHVVYSAIDAGRSATLSPEVISLIRTRIGFRNALITDAIEMSAVWPDAFSHQVGQDQFAMPLPKLGMIGEITRRSLAAGCDLVLHGDNSRDFSHTLEMMEAAPLLTEDQKNRLVGLFTPPPVQPLDRDAAQRGLDRLLNGS